MNSSSGLPKKIEVTELVSSRYDELYQSGALETGERPASWDDRIEGIDVVKTEAGEQVSLFSDGQQSPPVTGNSVMLQEGDAQSGYTWTLYGIKS